MTTGTGNPYEMNHDDIRLRDEHPGVVEILDTVAALESPLPPKWRAVHISRAAAAARLADAAVPGRAKPAHSRPLARVAAAALIALMTLSGLAAAEALPAPVQQVAERIAAVAGIDIPRADTIHLPVRNEAPDPPPPTIPADSLPDGRPCDKVAQQDGERDDVGGDVPPSTAKAASTAGEDCDDEAEPTGDQPSPSTTVPVAGDDDNSTADDDKSDDDNFDDKDDDSDDKDDDSDDDSDGDNSDDKSDDDDKDDDSKDDDSKDDDSDDKDDDSDDSDDDSDGDSSDDDSESDDGGH